MTERSSTSDDSHVRARARVCVCVCVFLYMCVFVCVLSCYRLSCDVMLLVRKGVPVVMVLVVASGFVCLTLLEVRSRAHLDSPTKAAVSDSFVNLGTRRTDA